MAVSIPSHIATGLAAALFLSLISAQQSSLAASEDWDGTWFAEDNAWRLTMTVDGEKVRGDVRVQLQNGWINGKISEDGTVKAKVGGNQICDRTLKGKMPKLRLSGPCRGGSANLEFQRQ